MSTPSQLLAAYDEQLRTEAETQGAVSVVRQGPLWLITFPGGRGFVTYRDLGGADAGTVRGLVGRATDHLQGDPRMVEVEWKARGHDHAPGLHEALLERRFVAEAPESIMLGEAAALAVDVPLPEGVTLRRITAEPDVRALVRLHSEVFGHPPGALADTLLQRLGGDDGMELWVAEAGGRMVSTGRLEPVQGTEFAGVWGGATHEDWRGRGIYRALTAARARSALRLGKRLLQSDSTDKSRPILERSGLVKVSTTTPYVWRREGGGR